jgi:hypothetical protein
LQRDRQRVRTDWLSSPDSGFSADWLFGGREKHRADVFVSLIGKLSDRTAGNLCAKGRCRPTSPGDRRAGKSSPGTRRPRSSGESGATQEAMRKKEVGGPGRNRTGIRGFAVRCITTLPPDPRAQAAYMVRQALSGQEPPGNQLANQPGTTPAADDPNQPHRTGSAACRAVAAGGCRHRSRLPDADPVS